MTIEFFKEKYPEEIIFKRNIDGTYKVIYKGMEGVDQNNELVTNSTIEIQRCLLEWEKSGFLPTPKIKEVLKRNANDEYFQLLFLMKIIIQINIHYAYKCKEICTHDV